MAQKSIDPLTFRKLCVDLRRELIRVLDRVQPADSIHYLDTTLSNSGIGSLIRDLLDRFRPRNKEIGLYVLRRHLDCPDSAHDGQYVMDLVEGMPVAYGDDRFVWHNAIGTHMDEHCICPCSAEARTSTHPILHDALISKEFDPAQAERLLPVYSGILDAYRDTRRKTARTSIQVSLLESVLILNDLILPVPVQSFIDAWYPLKPDSS